MLIVTDYRRHRIEVYAQQAGGAWNAEVPYPMKPHGEHVTCRKPTAIEAEHAAHIWGQRWVDRHAEARDPSR